MAVAQSLPFDRLTARGNKVWFAQVAGAKEESEMTSQRADIDRLWIRSNAHAEDIHELAKAVTEVAGGGTELARRIEKLGERTLTMTDLFMEGDLALGKRMEELEAKHDVGWEFLAKKITPLEKRMEEFCEEGWLKIPGPITDLEKRIERLERLLERGVEINAHPNNCNCIACGRPIEFENHVCYTLYGHPDADPPDATRECLVCWDGHEEKCREHTYRASWIKPMVVRNGKCVPYIPKED